MSQTSPTRDTHFFSNAKETLLRIVVSFPDFNRRGGIERVAVESANFLSRSGHQVIALSQSVDRTVLDPRVEHVPVPVPLCTLVRLEGYARNARRLYQNFPVDVHAGFSTASPAGSVFWVGSVHRRWIDVAKSTRGIMGRIKQRLNPFHRTALRLESTMVGGRNYRKLIALTKDVADDLHNYYGAPYNDIEILPNGVNTSEFKIACDIERREARRKLRVPDDRQLILFVANEVQRKGLIPLLHALSEIRHKNVHLLAVGRLGTSASWQPLLRKLGLVERVTFSGTTSSVSEAFAAADLFALPTIYEPWGLVIVEALASGLPVLTSRLAGAAMAVKEGLSGYLLDSPHDVSEIVSKLNPLLAQAHADKPTIRKTVLMYDWENILAQYEQILANSRGS